MIIYLFIYLYNVCLFIYFVVFLWEEFGIVLLYYGVVIVCIYLYRSTEWNKVTIFNFIVAYIKLSLVMKWNLHMNTFS